MNDPVSFLRRQGLLAICGLLLMLLSACEPISQRGEPGANVPPLADAGPDQTVAEGTAVLLDGRASSDSDGSIRTYSWTQVANGAPSVSLSDPAAVAPAFIAPDVTDSTDLLFELVVTDNAGAMSAVNSTTVTVIEPSAAVEIRGQVTFDMVPHAMNGGLDYSGTQQMPARAVLVEVLDSANQAVLASMATDVNGNFSFLVPTQIDILVRVRAQVRDTEAQPAWDFRVVDNDGVLDLSASKPLYVLDSSVFNSGLAGAIVDMHAGSGWDPAVGFYLSARSAAPFAILDVVYDAWQLVLNVDPAVVLPALTINWSPKNSLASNSIQNTSLVSGEIFVLGAEEQDTDEYDRHVIAHEWGHYFENAVSRTDSLGGPHSLMDKLDGRVALSEGWGNAFSAMVTNDEVYKDSCCLAQSGAAFAFSLEENCQQQGWTVGWYSECSAGSLIYDFFDSPPGEPEDTVSLGFGPIYDVFTNELVTSRSLTTLFSFVEFLQRVRPASATAVNTLVQNQNIQTAGQDEYGITETDNGGNSDALPLYRNDLVVGGPAINVCSNSESGDLNKLANSSYVRFTIDATANYRILATTTDSVAGSVPDPELRLFLSGFLTESLQAPAVDESLQLSLDAGEYVLEVWDDNNISASRIGSLDPGRYCVDLALSAI